MSDRPRVYVFTCRHSDKVAFASNRNAHHLPPPDKDDHWWLAFEIELSEQALGAFRIDAGDALREIATRGYYITRLRKS